MVGELETADEQPHHLGAETRNRLRPARLPIAAVPALPDDSSETARDGVKITSEDSRVRYRHSVIVDRMKAETDDGGEGHGVAEEEETYRVCRERMCRDQFVMLLRGYTRRNLSAGTGVSPRSRRDRGDDDHGRGCERTSRSEGQSLPGARDVAAPDRLLDEMERRDRRDEGHGESHRKQPAPSKPVWAWSSARKSGQWYR